MIIRASAPYLVFNFVDLLTSLLRASVFRSFLCYRSRSTLWFGSMSLLSCNLLIRGIHSYFVVSSRHLLVGGGGQHAGAGMSRHVGASAGVSFPPYPVVRFGSFCAGGSVGNDIARLQTYLLAHYRRTVSGAWVCSARISRFYVSLAVLVHCRVSSVGCFLGFDGGAAVSVLAAPVYVNSCSKQWGVIATAARCTVGELQARGITDAAGHMLRDAGFFFNTGTQFFTNLLRFSSAFFYDLVVEGGNSAACDLVSSTTAAASRGRDSATASGVLLHRHIAGFTHGALTRQAGGVIARGRGTQQPLPVFRMKPGYSAIWRQYRLRFAAFSPLRYFRQRRWTNYFLSLRRTSGYRVLQCLEFSLFSVVRNSLFFLTVGCLLGSISGGRWFVNGVVTHSPHTQMYAGDCLQTLYCADFLTYLAGYQEHVLRLKCRLLPQFLRLSTLRTNFDHVNITLLRLFSRMGSGFLDVPPYLEVDYLAGTVFFVYAPIAGSELSASTLSAGGGPTHAMRLFNWKYTT